MRVPITHAAKAPRSGSWPTTATRAEALNFPSAAAVAASGDKLKAELDDLLDEIDGVLETNAEDFVKSYVQKGGQ